MIGAMFTEIVDKGYWCSVAPMSSRRLLSGQTKSPIWCIRSGYMERKTCASLQGYAVSYLEEGSVGRPFGLSVDKQVVKDELADDHVYHHLSM